MDERKLRHKEQLVKPSCLLQGNQGAQEMNQSNMVDRCESVKPQLPPQYRMSKAVLNDGAMAGGNDSKLQINLS